MKNVIICCSFLFIGIGTEAWAQRVPRMAVFRAFKQGDRGNCASIAAIKAAINTFGPDSVFIRTETIENGVNVFLRHNNEHISITNAEIAKARTESDFKPDTSNIYYKMVYESAVICYAVLAKRRVSPGKTFEKSLEELAEGQTAMNLFPFLGLQDYVERKPLLSSTKGIQSLVVGSKKHAAFASYGQVDLWGKIKTLNFTRRYWSRVVVNQKTNNERAANREPVATVTSTANPTPVTTVAPAVVHQPSVNGIGTAVTTNPDPAVPQLHLIAINREWNKIMGTCCISGIDWSAKDSMLYAVSDAKATHIYRAKINILKNGNNSDMLAIKKMEPLAISGYDKNDGLESIRIKSDSIYISDEQHTTNPVPDLRFIKRTAKNIPEVTQKIDLPASFRGAELQDNTGIEGLSFSANGRGYWVAMERPFLSSPNNIKHPVTYVIGKTEQTYRYKIDDFPGGNDRGISEILAYDDNRILFLERHYAGTAFARLYMGTLLQDGEIMKTILVDLNKLSLPHVDNYEGMTWGPQLPNGHRTLILISDDNNNAGQNTDILVFEVK